MGLGLHGGGVGTVKFFAERGAKVLVTDIKKEERLKPSIEKLARYKNIEFVLGQHRSEDFIKADLIIKNPAVSPTSRYLEIARAHNVPIETDIGLFFELCPCPIIGITGTKGKSTTASLAYQLLSAKFDKVCLGGNIRISVLSQLKKLDKKSLCILELSSWQLEDMAAHKKSPAIAILLNIMPDHLNRYPKFQTYIEAKKNIFKYQSPSNTLILNFNDSIIRSFSEETRSKVVFFGKDLTSVDLSQKGVFLKRNAFYFQNQKKAILKLSNIPMQAGLSFLGEYKISNILAALTLAKLYHISDPLIRKTVSLFHPLEGRLERIGRFGLLTFYNDTAATIPEATIAALEALSSPKKKIILIAGGEDKELDYDFLARQIFQRVYKLILFSGSASEKILKSLKEIASQRKIKQLIAGSNLKRMDEAVSLAKEVAKRGDIILLSPGAASFNLFENEFDRGRQFKEAVQRIFK